MQKPRASREPHGPARRPARGRRSRIPAIVRTCFGILFAASLFAFALTARNLLADVRADAAASTATAVTASVSALTGAVWLRALGFFQRLRDRLWGPRDVSTMERTVGQDAIEVILPDVEGRVPHRYRARPVQTEGSDLLAEIRGAFSHKYPDGECIGGITVLDA